MIDVAPLPYPDDALSPVISQRSVRQHRVLEARYVRRVNEMIGPRYLRRGANDLTKIVGLAAEMGSTAIWEQASQAWNHRFWWQGLCPPGSTELGGEVLRVIRRSFGTPDAMVSRAESEARSLFGSGWLWLAFAGGKLVWIASEDACRPVRWPLLVVDLWEHAYWDDYPARSVHGPSSRDRFVVSVLTDLVNWDSVEARWAAWRRGAR